MDNDDKINKNRSFIRVECCIDIIIKTSDMAIPEIKGKLCDISAQGAMLTTHEKLYEGLPLNIHIKINESLPPLTGYVKWQEQNNEFFKIGIVFEDRFVEQNDRVVHAVTEYILKEIENGKNE